jgi:hypothetical protein
MKLGGEMLGGITVPECSGLNAGTRSTGVLVFRTAEKSEWQEQMTAAHKMPGRRQAFIS